MSLTCALATPAVAQPDGATALGEVRVTASPGASDGLGLPQSASVLRGEELDRRQGATLGDTLSQEPGVQSSSFGIGAGRPVIRGLGGARVRIANDGLESLDASTLSPDHAVTADPLGARQIEVLRGPATLLYGGGAIGGLVNVVSEHIPLARLTGIRGDGLLQSDSATRGGQGALSLRGGGSGWNWTASGFARDARDYAIAGTALTGAGLQAAQAAGEPVARGRLPNSFARSNGGTVGGSYVGERFTVGLAQSVLDSRYGIPGEDASISLHQTRTEGLFELTRPLPGFESLRLRHVESRYRHDELEASGEVGTAFRNRGRDTRLELRHAELAGIRGVVGMQVRGRDFSATGEEAYVPSTREDTTGLFWVGTRALGPARLELGARHERARLDPRDDTALPGRRFGLSSASVGAVLPLGASGYSVGAQLASAARAPTMEELYAGGPHAATRTYEIGNPGLRGERATNLELSLRRAAGTVDWKVAAYLNRFRNYTFGRLTDIDGDGVPDRVDESGALANSAADPGAGELARVVYDQARATFRGLEGELRWRPAGRSWSLRLFGDVARGTLDGAAAGETGPVPRMSPARLGVAADWARGPWSGFASLLAVRRQGRIAALETPTSGYERLDAELAYTLRGEGTERVQLFVQGRNLLDQEIRLATSFIKDVAPQPGRSVLAGVRGRF